MKESGFEFRVETIDVDESFPETMEADKVAEFISVQKSLAYAPLLETNEIGIVADTIVHLDGNILGKPKNKKEALFMLGEMSGKQHDVYTGVTIFDANQTHSFTGHSKVYFLSLTEEEKNYYIDKCQPFDKAGSYGVQEWIGYVKIEKIEGSYTNIMGLPMELVYKEIQKF
jgi:septum formation protein